MSTNNIGFYEELTKMSFNYHQITSNTQLFSANLLFILCIIKAFHFIFCMLVSFSTYYVLYLISNWISITFIAIMSPMSLTKY